MIKCKICNRKAESIIRSIDVCTNCFYLFKNDNLKRRNKDVKDLKILRECIKCSKRGLYDVIYKKTSEGLQIKPYYCNNC